MKKGSGTHSKLFVQLQMCPNALPSKSWPLFIPPSTSRPALEGGPDANMSFFLHWDESRLASVPTTRNHIKSTSNQTNIIQYKTHIRVADSVPIKSQ